jgi:hypothetical protein
MKYNTVMPYWQRAIKQSFTVAQDPNSGNITRTYFDDGEIEIRFISKQIGNSQIYTKAELQPFERVRDIRDRGGVLVTDEVYYVQTERPTLNPLGYSDGYSYKVAVVDPALLVTTP